MNTTGNTYWVYILASGKNGSLYVGVTKSLHSRTWQHRNLSNSPTPSSSFAHRYHVHRLVYFEPFGNIHDAIAREKQLKAGSRAKKIALIEKENPDWRDLAEDWFDPPQTA